MNEIRGTLKNCRIPGLAMCNSADRRKADSDAGAGRAKSELWNVAPAGRPQENKVSVPAIGGYWLLLLLLATGLMGCESEYQQYVDREMASGTTQDSLIFGMRIGQTKKDFYAICWELNKQKKISEGTGNRTARYIADQDSTGTSLEAKDMLFYGIFDDNDVMRGMDMTYSYIAWSPWNRDKQSDSLLVALRDQYRRHYPGNDFIEIDIKELKTTALVKIDGNRQILMYPKGAKDVVVKIEDLSYKLKGQWKQK